jgi:membrane protease subunit HflC
MMRGVAGVLAVLVAIAVAVGYTALFYVHQTEQALVLRFGEPIRDPIVEPGLQYKVPFVDTVVYIDKRILDLDNPVQEVIASDQKRLVVDAFARYRITNPLRFYQTVGSIEGAQSRLTTILNSSLRRVLGEATFIQAVRDERAGLMNRIRDQVNREAQQFGIDVVDVRIRRADLPDANSQAIYQRMQTERQQEAAEFRARGAEQGQRTRARADRDVTVLIGEANSKSEQIRGEGDGERNRIFADAFGKDPDFFSFYRTMQAYEAGLKQGETRMLLAPDSDFFRYFNDASGKGNAAPAAPGATPQR